MKKSKLKWRCTEHDGIYVVMVQQIGASYEQHTHVAVYREPCLSFDRMNKAARRVWITHVIQFLHRNYIQYWS